MQAQLRSHRVMVPFAVLAVAVATGVATGQVTAAGGKAYVTGGANKGGWTVAGTVKKSGSGAAGHIRILRDVEPRATVCDYTKFTKLSIKPKVAKFDAMGTCKGQNAFGPFRFKASNAFTISDFGEPGDGLDVIDVNFYGPTGIAIPGGVISDGNFDVRARRR